jgi:predicted ATP-binding protein involved in virulence
MKHAARNLLDGVKDFYFDWGLQDIVIVFGENEPCLFQNLSAGQRAILGLAFDLARRAATLNDFLGEDILSQTPGVVTIDELDMHLHPAWQRSIIHSLRKTFPKVQFIASTHSPQIIGEAQPHQVLIVEHAGVSRTERSFGMDSNRVLREIMGTIEMDSTTKEQLDNLALLIDDENFYEARQLIRKLSSQIGEDSPDLVHAHSLIELLEPTQ